MKTPKYMMTAVLFVILFAVIYVSTAPVYASSKAKKIELQSFETYKKYDVTGDGKKDRIKIYPYKSESGSSDEYSGFGIYVNGNCVYSRTGYYEVNSITANLYQLDNGTSYLEILGYGPDDIIEIGELLQYKSGKYKRIINLSENSITGGGYVKKITKNKIIITKGDCYLTLGTVSFDYTYTKKNGKWVESKYGKNPTIVTLDSNNQTTLVARRNFYVYKAVNSKTKAFKIKKGNKVQIIKQRVYKNKVYFQVKCKGKTAWIKNGANSASEGNPLFENLLYGGIPN
jgi:hypothetical protein